MLTNFRSSSRVSRQQRQVLAGSGMIRSVQFEPFPYIPFEARRCPNNGHDKVSQG